MPAVREVGYGRLHRDGISEGGRVPATAKLRKWWGPRHGEELGLTWVLVVAVLYAPVSLLIRTRYRHLERLPQYGPAIVVVNHVSHVDPFLVSKMIIDGGRRPRFLAKDTIFEVFAVGAAMHGMGHIPVKRGTADARQSFAAAVDALRAGGMIVMHPEGTVTRDPEGWPMQGKTGAARLALMVPDVPMIPIAQWGVQQQIDLYRRKVRLIPRPHHELSVGEPIDLSAFRDREPDGATLRAASEVIVRRLRHDVAELRGVAEPTGEVYRWRRAGETPMGDA
jgi:1-acyl-sn-glycerol-3-phosphate acyltransferase